MRIATDCFKVIKGIEKMATKYATTVTLILTIILVISASAWSVAPSKEAIEKWKKEGILEEKLNLWKSFKEQGGSSPVEHPVFNKEAHANRLALQGDTIDTVRVICILVDFPDHRYYGQGVAGEPYQFDSILFSDSNCDTCTYHNPTGSMIDYYMENSYGKFYIQGDIYGWLTMPETYAWYESGESGVGMLSRARDLAVHAVDAAHDAGAVFSDYDHNHDNYCDGVVIIHAGRGAEDGSYGIWSHKSTLRITRSYDGVIISDYTMNPEEVLEHGTPRLSPIGVVCHEYGHFLGLPDLYDINYDFPGHEGSDGLGDWTLMARGNYLGNSKRPGHMDAYCKAFVGFVEPIHLTSNLYQAQIPAVEYNPVVYKLQYDPSEYWLIENRQKTGFDKYLPSSGLCIYHVDTDAPPQNTMLSRYYVGLEQADGDNDLAFTVGNHGDAGDPFPGLTKNYNWHNLSIPNSRTNLDIVTEFGLWNISDSDSLMYADFDADEGYSRPWIEQYGLTPLVLDDTQGGDGDGIFEAGETIQFFCTVFNRMRYSYNIQATLSTTSPDVEFITQTVPFNANLFGQEKSNLIPIEFRLANDLSPAIDSFFLTITTDSLESTPGSGEFTKTFGFEVELGAPQVLLVDDDRGEDFEVSLQEAFSNLRIPFRTWTKAENGSPSAGDLLQYSFVFWYTGDTDKDVLTSDDISAMKEFLDNGKSLLLSTLHGIGDIDSLDPTFLTDYLHAEMIGEKFWMKFDGVNNNAFGDGIKFRYNSIGIIFDPQPILNAVNGGEEAIKSELLTGEVHGVTFSGSYQTILLSFPIEYISSQFEDNGYYPVDSLISKALQYFGGIDSSTYNGQSFPSRPSTFILNQNYPNPFNPSTTISYTLHATGSIGEYPNRTKLNIYNILGREVITLVDKVQTPGRYEVEWDGADRNGKRVGSGVYFYRLTRGDEAVSRKMILVK
ncbi:MAG: hypothetical protein DRP47_01850 [Candidatus Zixiibacteriota bacterium]|nr:MAG: hypothetical protein DRP47_01850 [candidate division Zixibacteria bacterium]